MRKTMRSKAIKEPIERITLYLLYVFIEYNLTLFFMMRGMNVCDMVSPNRQSHVVTTYGKYRNITPYQPATTIANESTLPKKRTQPAKVLQFGT